MTNESRREGHFVVTYGDGDEEKPPKLRVLAAGASKELAITQTGFIMVLDFKVRVVSVPKRKPENFLKTKAREASSR